MDIKSLLSSGNWTFCNKTLCQEISLEASAIVGLMCNHSSNENGWFLVTFEHIFNELGIKEHSSKVALQKLINHGILLSKRAGMPCKTYYKLDEFALISVFQNRETVPMKTGGLVPMKTGGLVPMKTGGLVPMKTGGHLLRSNSNIKKNNKNILLCTEENFTIFKTAYPRKQGIDKAEIAFMKLGGLKTPPTMEMILTSIQNFKKTDQWQDKKYIPLPATWLNGKRYLDEFDDNDFQETKKLTNPTRTKSTQQNYKQPKEI